MPETAETFGFGLGFDNLGDKRKTIDTIGEQVVFERSKSKRKIIVLLRRQILVAKENNLVIEKRLVNLLELLIAQPDRYIEAANFGADRAGLRYDFHDAFDSGLVDKSTQI